MGSLKLGLTTIQDRLGTKGIQLKLNFPNTTEKLSNGKIHYKIKWNVGAYALSYKRGFRGCGFIPHRKVENHERRSRVTVE